MTAEQASDNDAVLAELATDSTEEVDLGEFYTPQPQEAKEEEKPEETPEEHADDDADHEESEEDQKDDADQEPDQAEQKPRKGKKTARERIKELTDQRKDVEERAERDKQEFNSKLEEMRRENQELRDLIKKSLKEEQEDPEEDEPLDQAADKRYQEEFNKLRKQMASMSFKQAVGVEDALWEQKDKDWNTKKDIVFHQEANDLLVRGRARNEQEAMKMAAQNIADDMYNAFEGGNSPAEYINRRAQDIAKRYNVQGGEKPVSEKKPSKSTVNMAELEKLRQSAGAPENKSAAPRTSTGEGMQGLMMEINADIERDNKLQDWI